MDSRGCDRFWELLSTYFTGSSFGCEPLARSSCRMIVHSGLVALYCLYGMGLEMIFGDLPKELKNT